MLTTSKKWDEAVEKGVLGKDSVGNPFKYDFYFGNTGLIDIYDKRGKEWFWDIYKEYTSLGVGGWWGDLGEPEVHPSALQHAKGTADEVHNIYGHNWAELVFEGYKKDFPDQRVFNLMRAGYSGSQRFGMIPWSGDVSRSWGGLKSQPEIALQMGMQGLGYMHSDLGGFAGGETPNPKLYTRWLQYGVFQPIFRPHAQEHIPAEPIFWDEETKALAKKAIELRYSLLPYNYTLAFQNNQKGLPFMRPLFFEEMDNPELLKVSDTYFWGEDLVISPILEDSITQKEVYLPKNNAWFNFHTGKKYEGGKIHKIQLEDDKIPIFVRAGAFIPMSNPVQNISKEYSTQELTVHYYHDIFVTESEYEMYDDDGVTPNAFEKGEYEILEFESKYKNGKLELEIESELGENYSLMESRIVKLVIHGLEKEPYKMKKKGQNPKIEIVEELWNAESKTLEIWLELEAGKESSVKLWY